MTSRGIWTVFWFVKINNLLILTPWINWLFLFSRLITISVWSVIWFSQKPLTLDCEPHSFEWLCMGFWKSYSSFSVHTATRVAGVHSLSRLSKASLTSVCAAPLLHKDSQSKKNWIKPRKKQKRAITALPEMMGYDKAWNVNILETFFMFSKLARGWGF